MNGEKFEIEEGIDEASSLLGKKSMTGLPWQCSSYCLESCMPKSTQSLGRCEWTNLILLVLCYTCAFASTTIMVGGSAVAIVSVGGDAGIAPVALGVFFVGASAISVITAPLFDRLGRRIGFMVGSFLGLVGGLIGMGAIVASSPALVILSAFPTGMALGVGLHLRFAAMEVVQEEAQPFAMTLVLSGGCIAAFLGPESQLGTKDAFGDDLKYFGPFMMISIFNFIGAALVYFVKFPEKKAEQIEEDESEVVEEGYTAHTDDMEHKEKLEVDHLPICSLLVRTDILTSAALATLAWTIMAMPMSIFRVAMSALGYNARLSLTTLEFHFLGMYGPGFFAGAMIRRYGTDFMCIKGLMMFVFGLLANLVSTGEGEGSPVTWMMGLILLGAGWHFTFASATVMLAKTYKDSPTEARRVQSINDVIMFGIAGGLIVSTGYVYEAGGSGIDGWRFLNFVVVGFTVILAALLLLKKRKFSS